MVRLRVGDRVDERPEEERLGAASDNCVVSRAELRRIAGGGPGGTQTDQGEPSDPGPSGPLGSPGNCPRVSQRVSTPMRRPQVDRPPTSVPVDLWLIRVHDC